MTLSAHCTTKYRTNVRGQLSHCNFIRKTADRLQIKRCSGINPGFILDVSYINKICTYHEKIGRHKISEKIP